MKDHSQLPMRLPGMVISISFGGKQIVPFVIAAGILLVCVAMVLDTTIRLRLRDVGERSPFWRGGTLDYGRYMKLRREAGWSAWPVYLIPPLLLAGIGLVVLGLFRL